MNSPTLIATLFLFFSLTFTTVSQIINCDFSAGKIPDEITIGRNWKITDNVLRSTKPDGMYQFEIDARNWHTYDIEIKARKIATPLQKDNHFGFIFQNGTEAARVYFRDSKASIRVPVLKIHTQLGTAFESPLESRTNASWFILQISVSGHELNADLNGKNLGSFDKFPLGNDKISFYTYNNQMEISELRFVVHKTQEIFQETSAKSPNMALNASFEESTLGDLPDYWGVTHWGISDPYWILNYDKWQQYFRLDRDTAWHGKNSLRIENAKETPIDDSLVLNSCNFRTKPDSIYTFSAYMKANRPGVQVKMFSERQFQPYSKSGIIHTLTEEWQRYSFTYTRKNNSLYSDMLRIALMNKGIVWIDGIQLEEGKETTPFQLTDADRSLTTHEGNVEKQIFDVPIVNIPLLKQNPVLNGKLTDDLWKHTPVFELKSTTGLPVKEKSSARIFYTADGLYLGIDAMEADSDQIICNKKNRDDFVWTEPSFEIFLDSKLTRGSYHHLVFNADGVRYDANQGDSVWNGNWQVKTARKADKSGWTAEVFIPFSDLGINHNNGPLWGFNLCRNNPRQKESSCWAPTYGKFHSPLRFGQFAIDMNIQKQYITGVKQAEIKYAGEGKGELAITINNETGNNHNAIVKCRLLNQQNMEKAVFQKDFSLANKHDITLLLGELPVSPGENFRLESEIINNGKPLNFSSRLVSVKEIIRARVQHDYYTSEKEIILSGNVELNDKLRQSMKLAIRIENENGTVIYNNERNLVANDFEARIPSSEIPNGKYQVSCALTRQGKETAKIIDHFQKLPPATTEIKLDRFRRIILVNGKPFIPIGFSWEGVMTEELLEFLAKSGVNMLGLNNIKNLNQKIFDTAAKHGVYFQIRVEGRQEEKAKELIQKFKSHPAILAWLAFDEIFTTQWGKDNYPTVIRTIEKLQEIDPYHPVVIVENNFGLNYLLDKNLTFPGKIPMVDVYPWTPTANVQMVDKPSKTLYELGESKGLPVFFINFVSGYAFHASRDLSPAELEYVTYICIINGIRGFRYWADFPKAPSSFKTMTRLFAEIRQLQATLISLDNTPEVNCNSDKIKFTAKKDDNYIYLISVNETRDPVTARFDLSSILKNGSAEVLFENRNAIIDNSVLNDTWQGLQRHVYRFRQ